MSIVLDAILAQAADQYPATVALSPESVTVLLFASSFLDEKRNWLDERADPLDEITDSEWDTIEKLVANLFEETMNPLIGLIFPIMTALPPANCLLCDGSTYARVDYPNLYAALDPAFIVDADNFVVPDISSRALIGAGTGSGLSTYAVNETGGLEAVALTEDQNATHTHIDTGHVHSYQPPGVSGLALAPGELPVALPNLIPSLTGSASANIQSSGAGDPHENRSPFLALNFVVVAL